MTKKIVDDLYRKMLCDIASGEREWAKSRQIIVDLKDDHPDLSETEVTLRLKDDPTYTIAVGDSQFFMNRAAVYAAAHEVVVGRMLHGVLDPDGLHPDPANTLRNRYC